MTERETVDGWLANLGSAHFRLDQNGVCACRHDDSGEVVVEVPEGSGQVFLYASLGPMPPHGREAFFRHLLELNAYMVGSRGGALGLDPQSEDVVLSRAEPIEALRAELFQRLLVNFIAAAKGLKADLAQIQADGPADPGARDAPSPFTMIQA
jgi:hypothetical protein